MIIEFKKLIGIKEYNSVIKLLTIIGPDSRTHRIGVFLAGILRYARNQVSHEYEKGTLEEALVFLEEEPYSEEDSKDLILNLVDEICEEAGMRNLRKSSRGEEYSIAESTVEEYISWYNMPWEDH